jgi:cytochrome c oxidase subunit 2
VTPSPGLAVLNLKAAFSLRWGRGGARGLYKSGTFHRPHLPLPWWGLFLSALLLGGCGLFRGKKVEPQAPEKPVVQVTITAKKYSFTPNVIRVKQGHLLEITLVSEDVPHGFGIRRPDRSHDFGAFEPGRPLTVRILTDTKGTIDFYSTVYSGVGYSAMRGKIHVE